MQVTPDTSTALAARDQIHALPSYQASREETAAPRVRAVASFDRFPAWLRFVDTVHRAARSPIAIGSDVAVAALCAVLAGVPIAIAGAMAVATALMTYISGGYADRGPLETQGVLWFAARACSAIAFATLIGVSVASLADASHANVLRFGWSAGTGLLVMRGLTWSVLTVARRRGLGLRRTLIVGHNGQASMLARKLGEYTEGGLLPVAMLPLGNGHGFARFMREFPNAAELARSIQESGAEHVVLAPDGSDEAILECVKSSGHLDVTFSILPPLAEFFLHPGHVAQVGGVPLIPLGKIAKRRTAQPGKRFFDLTAATALMVLLSPLMLITAIAIKIFDRGPIFYRQERVGRGGSLFELLKFRSMIQGAERTIIDLRDRNATDGLLFKVVDDPRVTPVGRIIRRLSIDELPQLWNVIRGDMSLVGPRPLAVRPEDFGPIDGQRHSVAPGITGYWQINGGNGLSYDEMIKLDLSYIQNWSLWLDLRLVLRTFPALIHRRGPW
jgi:exopolysaccharide biosynthesis polyprenyl glycosylphosphotransferase